MNEEYVWKDVGVVGFDELMQALERADRKGYMPDAVKEAWEGFNWKPAQQQEPVANLTIEDGRVAVAAKILPDGVYDLYTSPPASKPWVGLNLDDRERLREKYEDWNYPSVLLSEVDNILREKNA